MFRDSLEIIEHSSIIDNIQEKSNKNIALHSVGILLAGKPNYLSTVS